MASNATDMQILKNENPRAWRRLIAADTQSHIPSVLNLFSKTAPKNAYSYRFEAVPLLHAKGPYFPNIATKVNVIFKDTFDAAIALSESREEMGDQDLNKAQEEDLCYRSTLSAALPPRFYPLEEGECIYSPSVYIFKENEEKDYEYKWCGKDNEFMPEVSVISISASFKPPLNAERTGYRDDKEVAMMRDYVRLTLRLAAYHHHRRLVLGALGCGLFGHPAEMVAQIFHDALTKEEEFGGWFERITFAVLDKDRQGVNFTTFNRLLNGANMVFNLV